MLGFYEVTGAGCSVLKNFTFQQEKGTTHILLSQDTVFLDELQDVITGKKHVRTGKVVLNGGKLNKKNSCFITRAVQIYKRQSITENILLDQSFFESRKKKTRQSLEMMMKATGLELDLDRKTDELSINDSLIVEMLRCYYRNPEFLLVREVSNCISVETHMSFIQLMKKMNERGTTILYLTNRVEEAVRIRGALSVVRGGEIQKTYKAVEVVTDPSGIYFDSFEESEKKIAETNENQFLLSLHKLNNRGMSRKMEKDIRHMLLTFAQYAQYELTASSCVIYLNDQKEGKIIDRVSSSQQMTGTAVLCDEMVMKMVGQNTILFLTNEIEDFSTLFTGNEEIPYTMICFGIEFESGFSILIQLNYDSYYIYSKRDSMMMQWIAQEIGVYLENSVLMGNSILLRESHHRIKNNLHVIVSLLEMEKITLPDTMEGENIREKVCSVFDSAIDRIKCIAGIHDLLALKRETSSCEIGEISKKVCEFYDVFSKITITADHILVPYSKAVSVALVINEIVCNSIKHNLEDKGLEIAITIQRLKEQHAFQIVCADNGAGFPTELSEKKRMGIGQMLIESVVILEFGGSIERYNDHGAVIKVVLPDKSMLPVEKREITE